MFLEILVNPWVFLAYTFVAYVAIFLVFVRLAPLSKAQWKRADYIWLTAAILGVLPTVLQNREDHSRFIADQTLNYAHADYEFARQQAGFNATYHCRTFVRSEYPPADFDQVVAAFEKACQRSRALLQQLPPWNPQSPPNMEHLANSLPSYPQPILNEDINTLRNALQDYDKQRKLLHQAQKDAQPSQVRDLLTSLSPLLLGFAIALRLVRVEGELRSKE